MGGSFNPAHAGHLLVARTALRRLWLDEVWWIVSPGNPLKSRDGLVSLDQRVTAARALAGRDPRIRVTDFETALGSPYTFATVAFLKRRFPATQFVWVMGADNLAQLQRWRRWRDIAWQIPIAVIDRPGWILKALASPAARAMSRSRLGTDRAPRLPGSKPPAWIFLPTRLSALSSTEIRSGRPG